MRAALLVSWLLVFAPSAPAFAGSPATDAKRAFDRGLAAFDAGRYAEAAAEFEHSLTIEETPTVWYNLALAYYRLHRWDAALTALERHVVLEPPEDPRQAKQIETMSAELKGKLALVEISIGTPDTTVLIDGKEVKERQIYLMPGRHQMEAHRPGHHPVKKSATLEAGTRLETKLSPERPLRSRVVVRTTPGDAQISIDGAPLAVGEYRGELSSGEHRVEATREGHVPAQKRIELAPGEEEEISLVLVQESAPIYTSWWFWTIAGVVVAGGAAVAIGVATRPGDFDGGSTNQTVRVLSR